MARDGYTMGQSRPGHTGHRGPGGMGRGGEKSKDFRGTWAKLIRYCRKFWPVVIVAVACAAGGTILTLIGPDKLSDLTDLIAEGLLSGIDMDSVMQICFTLVALYGVSLVLSSGPGLDYGYRHSRGFKESAHRYFP